MIEDRETAASTQPKSATNGFTEPVQRWFTSRFSTCTTAQEQAWPLIREGHNVLVVAPTGSGKTLAAFLSAIDQLSANDRTRKGVKVLYISPLKALGTDVAKNLEEPLAGIAEECQREGRPVPDIRIAVRSGDSTAQQRRAIAAHPPDILVTTPESLYLMLTSKVAKVLRTVTTVIVDEVHALAGTKRGAHLALSLERLDLLLKQPAQRIGLSATVRPQEHVARFLSGTHPVTVVNTDERARLDLRVVSPEPYEPGDNAPHRDDTASAWPAIQHDVLDRILEHRTTLVFVNSRGVAERFTAQLNDLYAARIGQTSSANRNGSDNPREPAHRRSSYGSTTMLVGSHDDRHDIAMAHHGSVSKERRKQIEDRLKSGDLRCVVATSSLELGIDMGSIDLVIQIAPPQSVSSGLQRAGRADHTVGGTSHMLIYPVTAGEIGETACAAELMNSGNIETIHMPVNPLDVLAQHTIAAASITALNADDWYEVVCKAAPFANLDRGVFDDVLGMISGTYDAEEFSAFPPSLIWDRSTGMLSGRSGAQRLAVTSGGTIPDRGMYTVVLPEGEAGSGMRRVGELDEEMVYESRVGDIITLGTSTWKISEITHDRVVVTPAPGRSARLPFWHGDSAGRAYATSLTLGEWTALVGAGLTGNVAANTDTAIDVHTAFCPSILSQLQRDGLDERSIRRLAQHLSQQRNATGVIPDATHIVVERMQDEEGDWTVVIHSIFGRRVNEPWALALNARLQQQYGFTGHVFAVDDGIVVRLPEGDGSIDIARLLQFDDLDELQHLVRTQVADSVLFAARFREIAARSLFMPRMRPGRRVPLWQQRLRAAQLLAAARMYHNFPLLLETTRECLQDVYDLPGLCEVMSRVQSGAITVSTATVHTASPMASRILFAFTGSVMYQYDVPQAERAATMLSIDEDALERLLGSNDYSTLLDAQSIDETVAQLAERTFWNELRDDDNTSRIHRYTLTHGPFTAHMLATDLTVDAETAVRELDRLARRGEVVTGTFDSRMDAGVPQWIGRDVLRRIRTRALRRARHAIRPVDTASFQRMIFEYQGVAAVGGEPYAGTEGVARVVEQLQGIALPMSVWDRDVLPARVRDYTPAMLDELIAAARVVWVAQSTTAASAPRVAFYPDDSTQLQRVRERIQPVIDSALHAEDTASCTVQQAIVRALANGGAYPSSLLERTARGIWQPGAEWSVDETTGELQEPVWSHTAFSQAVTALVNSGVITGTSLAAVRNRGGTLTVQGLWSLVPEPATTATLEQLLIDTVSLLLDRYGVIAQPIVQQEGIEGGFSALLPVLRRMEEHGTLVRGVFVEEFGAAQFATHHVVDRLRDVAAQERSTATVAVATLDPASLAGSIVRWPDACGNGQRPMRKSGAFTVMRGGKPILFANCHTGVLVTFTDVESLLTPALRELVYTLRRHSGACVIFRTCNGESVDIGTPIFHALRSADFVRVPQGVKLYR